MENNARWIGDKIGYKGLHIWIRRHKPRQNFCNKCKKIDCRLEIANISGEYKRDINDYEFLCVSCHKKVDKNLNYNKDFIKKCTYNRKENSKRYYDKNREKILKKAKDKYMNQNNGRQIRRYMCI